MLYDRIPIDDYPEESIVRKTQIPNLCLLPSGPRRVSISSLLYSHRMAELLFRFRRDFETILIDTAPMLQISDARVLARLSDGVILVCRAGHTTRDVAITAINCFEAGRHACARHDSEQLGSQRHRLQGLYRLLGVLSHLPSLLTPSRCLRVSAVDRASLPHAEDAKTQ